MYFERRISMWFIWIIVGIFSIITMILLCGKCSFLVAGYNMMSKYEKDKYDEKKVCKGAGVPMLLINFPLIFIVYIFNYSPLATKRRDLQIVLIQ